MADRDPLADQAPRELIVGAGRGREVQPADAVERAACYRGITAEQSSAVGGMACARCSVRGPQITRQQLVQLGVERPRAASSRLFAIHNQRSKYPGQCLVRVETV